MPIRGKRKARVPNVRNIARHGPFLFYTDAEKQKSPHHAGIFSSLSECPTGGVSDIRWSGEGEALWCLPEFLLYTEI